MRRDEQGVPGVVVQPGDDLAVRAGAQPVAGDLRLPGLIGHLGPKTQLRGPRPLPGSGVTVPARDRIRWIVARDSAVPCRSSITGMLCGVTPEWVLIIVAVIAALGGAATGALINQLGASRQATTAWERERQRKEAEHARED